MLNPRSLDVIFARAHPKTSLFFCGLAGIAAWFLIERAH